MHRGTITVVLVRGVGRAHVVVFRAGWLVVSIHMHSRWRIVSVQVITGVRRMRICLAWVIVVVGLRVGVDGVASVRTHHVGHRVSSLRILVGVVRARVVVRIGEGVRLRHAWRVDMVVVACGTCVEMPVFFIRGVAARLSLPVRRVLHPVTRATHCRGCLLVRGSRGLVVDGLEHWRLLGVGSTDVAGFFENVRFFDLVGSGGLSCLIHLILLLQTVFRRAFFFFLELDRGDWRRICGKVAFFHHYLIILNMTP